MPDRFADPDTLSKDQLENGAVFAPAFNANGLILAIACDAVSGDILMVAYMNEQALGLTLDTGEVHYYSRSRSKLWKKGEVSGEIQKLVEIRADCDQDVLQLKVQQTGRGAACHTGHKSCFYRKLIISEDSARLENDTGGPLFDPAKVYR